MPRPGNESATVVSASTGCDGRVVMHFHVQLHHLVHVERLHAAGDGRAQRVADKVAGVMVVEKLGIILEDDALGGLFHVHLDGQQALFAHLVEELVHHLERAQVARLGEGRALERRDEPGGDVLEDADGIGDQQRSRGRAGNDEQLGGLKKDRDVALLHEKAGDDGGEDKEDAYDGEHVGSPAATVAGALAAAVARFPPAWLLASIAWRARSSSCASVSVGRRQAWAAPMLTVSETRSPHQRKSAVRARPASVCACASKHLGAALVRTR